MKLQAFLPLVTYPDSNSDAIASNATAIAAYLGAELHAEVITAHIPNVSNATSRLLLEVPELIRKAEAASRQRGEYLLEKIREESAMKLVKLTTSLSSAALLFVGEAAAIEARYFDLSLLGWEAGNSTSRATAEAVLFGSGRPAILLPETQAIGSISHVAIAWDGSRVAVRAVADAKPFLERASKITVLTVVGEKPLMEENGAERLAAGLTKRGLIAEATPISTEDYPVGIGLQVHAIARGASLLVMGGYGHSVVRDFVLGGATEDVLDDLRLPVLCSH
ncbi:universal stress protein [Mesorhizobium sp.]|uniref:universal stress protein n=1 Tax=Mesorhizobium sp. TaxID=1871066 RepID=UPI0012233E0B|nr:universal stress protein [Mesorhizobium sp.]TIS89761.1 MAG: universal stress protein [Mesorhizobium sp.]